MCRNSILVAKSSLFLLFHLMAGGRPKVGTSKPPLGKGAARSAGEFSSIAVEDKALAKNIYDARALLADAHNMLFEVYGWFSEGFETADLQEARALLEEL